MDSRDEFRLRAYAAEKRLAELEAENAKLREISRLAGEVVRRGYVGIGPQDIEALRKAREGKEDED